MRSGSLIEVLRGVLTQHGRASETVDTHQQRYRSRASSDDAAVAARFYDLVTDFYEYGWGQSFHFAPRHEGEALAASLARLEHFVALRLGLRPGHRVLDAGCGIGGPMRSIARFSGASVEGVTVNAYQVERGQILNAETHLSERCRSVQGDFTKLAHAEASFDAAYSLEAICHVADRATVLRELRRVVKPGGLIAGTDWCLTDRFRAGDAEHERIRHEIEEGNGLARLMTIESFRAAFRDAGLELLESRDLAERAPREVPWYAPLEAGWRSPTELRRTRLGRRLTGVAVRAMERTGIAPPGTVAVADLLNRAADGLIAAGEREIFTPLFFFCARHA